MVLMLNNKAAWNFIQVRTSHKVFCCECFENFQNCLAEYLRVTTFANGLN